jgi:hypothetical protein
LLLFGIVYFEGKDAFQQATSLEDRERQGSEEVSEARRMGLGAGGNTATSEVHVRGNVFMEKQFMYHIKVARSLKSLVSLSYADPKSLCSNSSSPHPPEQAPWQISEVFRSRLYSLQCWDFQT